MSHTRFGNTAYGHTDPKADCVACKAAKDDRPERGTRRTITVTSDPTTTPEVWTVRCRTHGHELPCTTRLEANLEARQPHTWCGGCAFNHD